MFLTKNGLRRRLYLTLMRGDASQREHPLRELFNGLRYVIRYLIAWRAMPNDLPPWLAVYQRAQRWLAAGVFEALAQDLRAVLRLAAGHLEEPTAAIRMRNSPRGSGAAAPCFILAPPTPAAAAHDRLVLYFRRQDLVGEYLLPASRKLRKLLRLPVRGRDACGWQER